MCATWWFAWDLGVGLSGLVIRVFSMFIKIRALALAGVSQWLSVHLGAKGSIPSQGTCLVWGVGGAPSPPSPPLGLPRGSLGRQPHIGVSLPVFLPPFSKKIFLKKDQSHPYMGHRGWIEP